MSELEQRIARWREAMAAVLPEPAVRELEAHLRDHIEALMEAGVAPLDAFSDAMNRIGEAGPIAEEFRRRGLPDGAGHAPRHTRWLRWLAVAGLSIGLGLVFDLMLLSLLPQSHGLFERLLMDRSPTFKLGVPLALTSLIGSSGLIVFAVRRLHLRSVRGWVSLGLVLAAVGVANLILSAVSPSMHDGFAGVLGRRFWRSNGLTMILLAFTAVAIWIAARRLRPLSPRRGVVFALIVAAIFVLDLILAAFAPAVIGSLQATLFIPTSRQVVGDIEIGLFLVVVVPVVLFALLQRLRLSWPWLGAGCAGLALILGYLASDDPAIRRPLTFAQLSPEFPGADQGYEVLMRYGQRHLGRNFQMPRRIFENFQSDEAIDPGKPREWMTFLVRHRAGIQADWTELAPVRQWWAELATFERIGDFTSPQLDAEMMAFGPVRSLSQHACAVASLQALDGRGDEAIATLVPMLEVSRKLQPYARSMIRQMLAIVVERMSIETAEFILDHATVSPAAREQLAAALVTLEDPAAGARRLMATEYARALAAYLDRPLLADMARRKPGWFRESMNLLSPFLYNPRVTFNRFGEYAATAEELLATRRLELLDQAATRLTEEAARPRIKNLMGTQFLGFLVPAYRRVGESYWKTQDSRVALQERLKKAAQG